jgi:sulfur-oxidizing protein SoxY
MTDSPHLPGATRRIFLVQSTGAAAAAVLGATAFGTAAGATPGALQAAIREIVGDAALRTGRVTLDLPPLAENGNSVSTTVSVDSPMTAADHVKAIHLLNEKNPQPHVMSATLGPRAGKAQVNVRIKLADSQTIVAIAETSDGTFWTASADVIVTLAACVEDMPQ